MSTLRFIVACTLQTVCATIFLGISLSFGWIAWQDPSYTNIEIAILFTPLFAYIAIWELWLPILRSPYLNPPSTLYPTPPRGVVSEIYCRSTGALLTSEAIPQQGSLDWSEDVFDRDELEELLRTSQDVLASHQK